MSTTPADLRTNLAQVIPEGAGPCQPSVMVVCDRFCPVPGSVRAYAVEGSGVKARPKVDPP